MIIRVFKYKYYLHFNFLATILMKSSVASWQSCVQISYNARGLPELD